ncbi:hypothetical protein XA68_13463 [Ophiocordyceps unilateralis]|uniref:Uncharacterized protein n=1 Tax=Ophiocordyceps unilateralis TaxID=268505 RepID=A0A2A9PCJ0_OPHUN|nr:hypothetical protein XA68_13463 [Ophiocordyceps unilateralis]
MLRAAAEGEGEEGEEEEEEKQEEEEEEEKEKKKEEEEEEEEAVCCSWASNQHRSRSAQGQSGHALCLRPRQRPPTSKTHGSVQRAACSLQVRTDLHQRQNTQRKSADRIGSFDFHAPKRPADATIVVPQSRVELVGPLPVVPV